MIRLALIIGSLLVLVAMTAVTTWASLERNVLDNGHLLRDRWFLATLADTYFAFLAVYLWIFYRETGWVARLGWAVGVFLLGNFAIAAYVGIAAWHWDPSTGAMGLLGRRSVRGGAVQTLPTR